MRASGIPVAGTIDLVLQDTVLSPCAVARRREQRSGDGDGCGDMLRGAGSGVRIRTNRAERNVLRSLRLSGIGRTWLTLHDERIHLVRKVPAGKDLTCGNIRHPSRLGLGRRMRATENQMTCRYRRLLLHYMCELVRKQSLSCKRRRLVLIDAEHHVGTRRVCSCTDVRGRTVRLGVGVYPHRGEIAAEPACHLPAYGRFKLPSRRTQCIGYRLRNRSVHGPGGSCTIAWNGAVGIPFTLARAGSASAPLY